MRIGLAFKALKFIFPSRDGGRGCGGRREDGSERLTLGSTSGRASPLETRTANERLNTRKPQHTYERIDQPRLSKV